MGTRQLSVRWMCWRWGTFGRCCQLAPAPQACWGSLCCGETARCRLEPCQPLPATATAAKCLSSSFPKNQGLGENAPSDEDTGQASER